MGGGEFWMPLQDEVALSLDVAACHGGRNVAGPCVRLSVYNKHGEDQITKIIQDKCGHAVNESK